MKTRSIFYPPERLHTIRTNAARHDWARTIAGEAVENAEYWLRMPLDEVWEIMFSPGITRSWFVWSNGHCPACLGSVPMFSWKFNAKEQPWKVRCPHCGELFPKNDFQKYYRSGLDARGLFDESMADQLLLYNEEHPALDDPLRGFCVDGGHGYAQGENRWWFIGAYLVFGQWKQLALGGVKSLAEAYAVTGERAYARRAAVLLDRIADVFPGFSFLTQGIMYDVAPYVDGFVSYSVAHCMEMKDIVEAYDTVYDAIRDDDELLRFLAAKALQLRLDNTKSCFADIRQNIETNLLELGISDAMKLDCNFPWEHVVKYLVKTVLDRPEFTDEREALFSTVVHRSTAVDGTSGEKGLANYAAIATNTLAMFLASVSQQDNSFLERALARWPNIKNMYRFFIDALCIGRYLPTVGDSGFFAYPALMNPNDLAHARNGYYASVFTASGIASSAFTLLGSLYEKTGDPDFIRIICHGNNRSVAGLPHDINCPDVEGFQHMVADVIAREGEAFRPVSVNKESWHLALMRDGHGEHERVACLTYDMRGADLHGHCDGLSLGLYAKGLNLLPDFGYPPVQYGGWFTPNAFWYAKPSAHNTVVVDGKDQVRNSNGSTVLWADGMCMKAITLDGRELTGIRRYERTTAMVGVSETESYLIDVFRVSGGCDHAFFLHGYFGDLRVDGVALAPAAEYGNGALMRNFRGGPARPEGYTFDWRVEDRYALLPHKPNVHLRYTGLSTGVDAYTCEAWVNAADYDTQAEAWIPAMMLRRQSTQGQLSTTFAGVIEPYEGRSNISSVKRLPIAFNDGAQAGEGDVAVEIGLVNGRRDLIVSLDRGDARNTSRTAIVTGSAGTVEFCGALGLWSAENSKDEWRIST